MANLRDRLKSTTYFVAITQTSFQRTSSTPPFGLSLNASYLALFKRPLTIPIYPKRSGLHALPNRVNQANSIALGIIALLTFSCSTLQATKERPMKNSNKKGNCSPLGERLCCLPRRFRPTYGKYASSRGKANKLLVGTSPRLSSKGRAVTGERVVTKKETILPPTPKKIEKKLTKHGDTRTDFYYWMRERKNPEVLKHIKSENTYTEKKLQPISDLKKTMFTEMVSRIKKQDASVPVHIDNYYYYSRYEEKSEFPIIVRKKGSLQAKEEILLDGNHLAKGQKFFNLGGWNQSPNHRWIAFSTDTIGRNFYTTQIKDLKTGQILNTKIENVTRNAVWAEDNQTLFYTKQHPTTLRYEWIYSIDIKTGKKKLIYHEKDEKFSTFISKSRSKKYLFIINSSQESSEYWMIDSSKPHQPPRLFSKRRPNLEYDVRHAGDFFFVHSNKGAKNFKIFRTPNGQHTDEKHWKTVINHRPTVFIRSLDVFKDHMAMYIRKNGITEIEIFNRSTKNRYIIPQNEESHVVYIENNPNYSTKELRYNYSSMTTPASIIDFNLETKKKTVKKVHEVRGDFKKENYISERIFATSKDGVKIPISLVYRKNVKKDGSAPLLLYGYGSYGATINPWFSSTRLSLLDRGFIFAIAHVRGSSTMGKQWYLDGKYLKKKNTFDDFIAAADDLISQNYTQKNRIYAHGASAGGLLMGAVINKRPKLFHGVVVNVPFVDALTTMLDESIPLTTNEYEEWGNPNLKKYYTYIKSYSPYDNIKRQPYPNLLVTSGFHDSQVQYWEPTKWVAKLRDLNTSQNLILLDTNLDAGHGGKSGRFNDLEDTARDYAFFVYLYQTLTSRL